MKRGGPTRLGIGLLVVIVAAAVIGGVIWVGRNVLGGGKSSDTAEQVSAGQKLLNKPSAATAVRLSVRGPITAEEEHYSIAITVSAGARELVVWRGYDGTVMKKIDLDNSAGSFNDLAAALNRAGMMQKVSGADNGNQGICAVGQLIQFAVLDGDKTAEELWTTSCAGLKGNFDGLAANVIDLFLNQIPVARSTIDAAKNTLNQEQTTASLKALGY